MDLRRTKHTATLSPDLRRRATGDRRVSVEIAFLNGSHVLVVGARDDDLTLLGWYRGERCVLVEVNEAALTPTAIPVDSELRELRPLAPLLPPDSASLLAYARALALWKGRHRHCGVCGAPNRPARAGHVMRCTRAGCGTEAFPRLDPAIIVLVTDADGERALLAARRLVQGPLLHDCRFRRAGESLEDAVVREVDEETGCRWARSNTSRRSRGHSSSLMLGFRCRAHPCDHTAGRRARGRAGSLAPTSPRAIPRYAAAGAISARLIDAWLGGAGEPSRRW
jgi:NAD+ diphosphatase